jgi:hypothetical protein
VANKLYSGFEKRALKIISGLLRRRGGALSDRRMMEVA